MGLMKERGSYAVPNKFTIRSDIDNEDSDVVVCIPVTDPLKFDDNLIGRCSKCNIPVQFRPTSPKKPPKICWNCALPDMEREMNAGNLEVAVSSEARKDIMEFLSRKMRH